MATPSKKSIDRAGITLRDWWRSGAPIPNGNVDPDEDPVLAAVGLVTDFREGFAAPLNSVQMGIRSMMNTIGVPVVVSQRLKRLTTIIDKLDRHGNMKVTRMQDIGGCRAILPDDDAVKKIIKRIAKNSWDVREVYDYVQKPKSTGYRAVHVVVVQNGRMIELQLRTDRQHGWATTVERLAGRPDFQGLKDGNASDIAVDYFEAASRVIALQEAGLPVDEQLVAEFMRRRDAFRELDVEG